MANMCDPVTAGDLCVSHAHAGLGEGTLKEGKPWKGRDDEKLVNNE